MPRTTKLDIAALDAWSRAHPSWERSGEALVRAFTFPDFASGLAFVVRVGCWAERHDHHPDVELGWGRVRLTFTTHDAGGITRLDVEAAEACDGYGPPSTSP